MKNGILYFFLLLQFSIYAQTGSSISFSEVMFYPLEANGEFIELYNSSSDSSINLSKYKIIYHTSSADTIIGFKSGTLLHPNSYAVILENDYDSTNGIYFQFIPDTTLVLQIDNGKFGSSGMANSSNRTLHLLNVIGDTIDTYTYSANNKKGYSDEKINEADSNYIENWGNSISKHGTPGFKNSVSPRDYDLIITSLSTTTENIFVGNEIEFTLKVKNLGLKDATDFGLKMFVDFNQDSIAQSDEVFFEETQSHLLSGDSLQIIASKKFSKSGTFTLFAEVDYLLDERTENNFNSIQILLRPKPNKQNDIVINEIMYKPNGDEPEWIEIYNRTSKKINLNDWRITDKTSKPQIADSTYFIGANEYLVLTEEETLIDYYEIASGIVVLNLPSLNNAGDKLKLIDSLNQVIDSVEYSANWGGGSGYSLERISIEQVGNDSSNWKSSVSNNFATPGKINSVTQRENDLSITKLLPLKNYATIGENFDIQFKVENVGLTATNDFKIEIYHDTNFDSTAQVEELSKSINGEFFGVGDSLNYRESLIDFSEGENNYIIKLVSTSDDNIENNERSISFVGVRLNEVRGDIVINEIMHSPKSPEPEWIEVFNNSTKNINLKNYQIADNTDTVRVLSYNKILTPGEYFVFADDSSFIDVYPKVKSFTVENLPGLNNSGDRIIILDSLNRIIDSLFYNNSWGGKNGKSIERIDVKGISTDSTNWQTTTKPIGGTPSKVNSVSIKNYDVALSEILFIPNAPQFGDNVLVLVKVINVGKEKSEFSLQLFEDVNLDSSQINLLETSSLLSLNSGDSLTHQFIWKVESIKNEHKFIASSIFKNDEDSSNNLIKKSISPGFTQASIIVNEIMYSPTNGEPEWVELLNTTNDSISISGFTISDIYTTPKITTLHSTQYIKPNEYIVISKDSSISDFHSSINFPIIINPFANLNNDIDGIVIKDSFGKTIDSVEYKSNWGGNGGFSLERVLKANSSTDSTNWKSSTDIELSTPGRKNSATPFINDLAILEITTVPQHPTLDDDVFVMAKIKNVGLSNAQNFTIKISYQVNNALSILNEMAYNNLSSNDSITLKSEHSFQLSDSTNLFVELNYSLDENLLNNKIEITLYPGARRSTILINEFMANPKTDEAEWIEILNNSQKEIDISNWFVSDLFTTPKLHKITEGPIVIKKNDLFVICNDTSKYTFSNGNVIEVKFGTLGNSNDGIILYDFNKSVVDSLQYDKDWQIKKGRSLERVSSTDNTNEIRNWLPSLSTTGATPGVSNSILETKPSEENSIIINEIMFDPKVNNSEFVELFNPTENEIDIGGWELVIDDDEYFEISSTFLTLKSGDYFVIASDSAIFKNYNMIDKSRVLILKTTSLSLSNSGESLVVIDHWGNIIDSVFYNPKWHNKNIASTKNKSLERIAPTIDANEPTNWSSSVNKEGATPGRVNSIFAKNRKVTEGISFNPNPFSPDNDGFEDFSIINYSLPFNTAQIRIKIFDDHGRLVRTLVNNKSVASNGSIIFDGLDDNGTPLRIGMYILFLEAVDIDSGTNRSYKDIIVVARKL